MNFTHKEIVVISDKLEKAKDLICEAENLVRKKDKKGESDIAVHIDSDYNNLTDTLFLLWSYHPVTVKGVSKV